MMTRIFALMIALFLFALPATAQDDAFEDGWRLVPEGSALNFQSIKNGSVVETSSFATVQGVIEENGKATIKVLLDSVDTKVDLRNVRMRFLFFESFTYPEATITTQLTQQTLEDLIDLRRKTISMPYTIDLHGVTQERSADVSITLISPDVVSVSSAEPITLPVADFNLMEGIRKLEAAAGVTIVPSTSVTFQFLFERNVEGGAQVNALFRDDDDDDDEEEDDSDDPVSVASVALEPSGNFDEQACVGRFEIFSRAGNIYFRTASARLNAESNALLDQLYDVVSRCPGMTVEVRGHTDSDGSDQTNATLSNLRAASVVEYLTRKGIEPQRLRPRGMGEGSPVVPNTTSANKALNRRIEFVVLESNG